MELTRIGTVVSLSLTIAGCTGMVGDPSGGQQGPGNVSGAGGSQMVEPGANGASYVVPASNLRRLTRREYNNTLRDLLSDSTAPGQTLADDAVGVTGYETPGSLGALEVEAFMEAARGASNRSLAQLGSLVGCTPTTQGDEEQCATQFISSLGERAYRRALVPDEASDLLTLFREVRRLEGSSFGDGIGALIQGMLNSPNFLYHRERGAEQPVLEGGQLRLTSNELASRLSYFIAGTMPDSELLQAARAGALNDPGVLAAHARRLAAVPGVVAESITDFARQWLELDVAHLEKNATSYPEFAAVRPFLADELGRFVGHVVEQGLPPSALLSDTTLFVNRASAGIYGLPAPATDQLVAVPGDPSQRAGIFTQLAFLSTHATTVGSHPVKRGKVLFDRLLCGTLPPPPPNVPPPAAPQPGQTTRERFELHSENACAGCHQFLDPLGFSLESYDAVGRFRTTEAGIAVDSSGTLTLPTGLQVSFESGVELMTQLAKSSEVRTCLTRHLVRYGAIVPEGVDESVAAELEHTATGEGTLVDLYVSIVTSSAFRYRALAEGETL